MIEKIKNLTTVQIAIIIYLTGFIVYFLSLFNGFVADDHVYILNNLLIRKFDLLSFFMGSSYYTGDINQLGGIYFKPIFTTITSFIFVTSNGTAAVFHIIQVLIHLTNSFLVFLLFSKYFKRPLSFFLSLLFLLHPGNVESVVYIADLQDVLFFLFGISSLLISLSKKLDSKKSIIVGILLLFSLLSKESGILFIPSIIILSLVNKQSFSSNNKHNIYPISLIVTAVLFVYFLMRFAIAQVTINHLVIAPIMDAPFLTRLITVPKIIYSYIILFFFPKNLSWGQHWVIRELTFNDFYLPIIVITILLLIITLLFFKSKKEYKLSLIFFFSCAIFGLGLHSQIIPLDFTFAERWFYFTSMAFIGITGVILTSIQFKKINRNLVVFFALAILIILSTRTFLRTLDWKDDYTLTTKDIQVDPNSLALENNLGYELIRRGQFEKAIPHLEKSIRLFPHTSNNSAYVNLAFAYSKNNQPDKSLEAYEKALAISDHHTTYHNYIAELIRQKQYDKAREILKIAISKYPNDPKMYLLISALEYLTGNKDIAIQAAQKANQLLPGSGNYLLNTIKNNKPLNM